MNKKTNIFLLTIIFSFLLSNIWAQYDSQIIEEEDNLKILFDSLYYSTNDSTKIAINNEILDIFEYILYIDASFDYPFDSLTRIGKIKSKDGLLRIYNWNIAFNNNTNQYFGFIQYNNKPKEEFVIYPLIDKSDSIDFPEKQSLDNENWYGALYYEIIESKSKYRNYYTLLGWDGYSEQITRKVIDVLYFSMSGKPHFGANIFHVYRDEKLKSRKIKKKRIIFNYSGRATMMLRYDKKSKMIYFDHLAPRNSYFKDNYQYYGPDMSFDALFLRKGNWIQEKNIDIRTSKSKIEIKKWEYKPEEDIIKHKTKKE